MAAWGYGNFDNDDALDWVDELVERDSLSAISLMLEQEPVYLEASECNQVLAAAETVAALAGRPSDCIPEELRLWVRNRMGGLVDTELARDAVTAILEDSELRQLWEHTDMYPRWHAEQQNLLRRL